MWWSVIRRCARPVPTSDRARGCFRAQTNRADRGTLTVGHATARDGVKLYYEETGTGVPILFIHEFAGDHRAWEPQLGHFGRRRRCIVYSARGTRIPTFHRTSEAIHRNWPAMTRWPSSTTWKSSAHISLGCRWAGSPRFISVSPIPTAHCHSRSVVVVMARSPIRATNSGRSRWKWRAASRIGERPASPRRPGRRPDTGHHVVPPGPSGSLPPGCSQWRHHCSRTVRDRADRRGDHAFVSGSLESPRRQ